MYRGQSIVIPQTGGWNLNPNEDESPIDSMRDVDNINLHNNGRQPRGGCAVVNTTNITDSPEILGIYQYVRENGNVISYYLVDESADNIGDENGNVIVSESGNLITATSDGAIQNNQIELRSGFVTDVHWFFETFQDTLYSSNNENIPQIWDGVEAYTWDLGTPKVCVGALAGAAGNVDNGTHSYKVTFVSAAGESTPSQTSNVVTVTDKGVDGQVSLTSISVGPTGTTSRKVYRTVAGDTGDYLLLTTISDNTTTTYTDNTADAGLGAAAPTTNRAFWPSDWDADYPKVFVKHSRRNINSLWAYGCRAHPNRLYIAQGLADFSDDNVITIDLLCPQIVGLVEVAGNMLAFGSNRRAYLIDDISLSTAAWGSSKVAWEGGAAHQNLIVHTPTDIAVMQEDGNIFSVRAAESIGDSEVASLVRPAFINKWIEENADLEQIEKFHAVYDPELRAIKWFVVRKQQIWPDTCLVYFIDRGPLNGWSKHSFAIKHCSSVLVRTSISDWKVQTGGNYGAIFELENENYFDNEGIYYSSFKTQKLSFGNIRVSKKIDKVLAIYKYLTLPQEYYISAAYIMGGLISSGISRDNNKYDPDIWTSQLYMPLPSRSVLTASEINEAIYIFGGVLNGVNFSDTDKYIINLWENKTEIIDYGRSNLASTNISDKIYLFGGTATGIGDLQDTDEYDPDTWANKTDMPSPARTLSSAIAILAKGYILGGYESGVSRLQDTDEYNPSTNTWANKTDMPAPARNTNSGTVISSKGYTFAGYSVAWIRDTDEYDPDVWTSKTDAPAPARGGTGSSTVDNIGYVFGGIDSSLYYQDTDEYDPDTWTSKTDIPVPARSYPGAATMDYLINPDNELDIYLWIDDNKSSTSRTISITNTLNTKTYITFIGAVGKRFQIEYESKDAKNYFISQLIFDVENLGA